jgi:hypothetical protein
MLRRDVVNEQAGKLSIGSFGTNIARVGSEEFNEFSFVNAIDPTLRRFDKDLHKLIVRAGALR